MRLSIFSFTHTGEELADRLSYECRERGLCEVICCIRKEKDSLYETVADRWDKGDDLVFIGAAGIAVRAIAPLIASKLTDRAVIVIDEAGSYVIPILSGHVGGANRLARSLADILGAKPVITTATDVKGIDAVDIWAAEHGLAIMNKEGIARVSGKQLAGAKASVVLIGDCPCPKSDHYTLLGSYGSYEEWQEDSVATETDMIIYDGSDTDVINKLTGEYSDKALILTVKRLIVGIGCKRGTPADKLMTAIDTALTDNGLDKRLVDTIATIDIKGDEPGMIEVCSRNRWSLKTFGVEELGALKGEYTASDFVRDTVGVDNVCERASVKAGGSLVVRKTVFDGVTVAVSIM